MDNNVLEIRFEGFDDSWEQRKLGEVGTTYTGLSGKTKEDFGYGNGKFVTYMNVFSNTVGLLDMTEAVEIDDNQNKVLFGDVLFTTSSETPEEVGMSSVWLGNAENTYLNSFCFGYRPTVEFNLYYLAYMLRSSSMRKKITFLAQGISRYNISKNKMMDIEIPIPNIEEQKQIGSYFCSLDHLITLHQSKYEKLLDFKESMLYKLFPKEGETIPEMRFGGFSGQWQQRKLGELSDKIMKKNQGVIYEEVFTNSAEFGIISQRDFFDKEIAKGENIDGYYVVEPDDFVYNPRISTMAPYGPIKRNKLGRVGAMSPLYYVFRPHDINLDYLECFFQSNGWHEFMRFNGNTGARSDRFAITDKIFNEMPILLPQDADEQKAIGEYFYNLDQLIQLNKDKVEKLKNIKSSLLDKMFV